MIGWRFPVNNGGPIEGFNDAGIETFRGDPMVHLAREVIQNSLDAADPNADGPVRVQFSLLELPAHEFPGIDEYRDALNRCLERWGSERKSRNFFENALKLLHQDKIRFLRVSDFNTTGLTGADLPEEEHFHNPGAWQRLVRGAGISEKPDGSGGSFGIGKNAPFACSQLQAVFYSTLDLSGVAAFQGVSKLATFMDADGQLTRSIGYYGHVDGASPILDVHSRVSLFFHRAEVGTDIYIAGFRVFDGWESQLIRSVLDNFLVALFNGRLVVEVGGTLINRDTMEGVLANLQGDEPEIELTRHYFRALVSPQHDFHEHNFLNLGSLRLVLVKGPDCPKRVAMVRATGMKIFDKGHFRTPMRFAGVLVAAGRELNEILRAMEPPAHNAWEPERHQENPGRARRVRAELYKWLNSKVAEMTDVAGVEKIDIEGVGQYLPDAPYEPPSPGSSKGREATQPEDVDEAPEGEGTSGNGEDESGNGHGGTSRSIRLKNARVFCTDESTGEHHILFVPQESGAALLSVSVVGEDGLDPAPLALAWNHLTGEQVIVRENRIGPLNLVAGMRTHLLVKMQKSSRYALEVSAHADS